MGERDGVPGDLAEEGLKKGRRLAEKNSTFVDFYRADINDFELKDNYDIVFCSGALHYITPEKRSEIISKIKAHTVNGGLNVLNVFVEKPFIINKKKTTVASGAPVNSSPSIITGR